MASTVAYRSPPIQPGVAPDPNFLMRDLDMQFTAMVRNTTNVSNWHTRFAYTPATPFASMRVDLPVDLTSFLFEDWTGVPTFEKGVNVKIRVEVAPFWKGAYVNCRELEDPASAELIAFEQRATNLMGAWNRHLPPKIFAMIEGAEAATISGGHPVTGASAFFATDHYVNVKKPDYGRFSNLIGNGGALASEPIYAVVEGGAFDFMKPWCILNGSNLARARAAGGRATGGQGGMPWIVHWEAQTDSEFIEMNMERRMGVYAERGYGMLFPHTLVRYEGTLDYAGLLSIVDTVGDYRDLNGYMQADQTRVSAFLVRNTAQRSIINGLLGRDITDTASTGVKIDERLKAAEVIVMSR